MASNMRTFLNSVFILSAILFAPVVLLASETKPASDEGLAYNPVLWGLVGFIFTLVLVIALFANVIRQLLFAYREKMRADKRKLNNVAKTVLLLLALSLPSHHSFAAAADSSQATIVPFSGTVAGMPAADYYTMIFVIALELVILMCMALIVRMLVNALKDVPEMQAQVKAVVKKITLWERINARVPVEKEKDILLDHDYDGIRELDNSLPPWWKYGFYVTILASAIYLYRFQVAGTGPNPEQEYAAEMKKADEDKAIYLANSANNIDENTVVLLHTPDDLSAGQQVFQTTCAACHAKDGGGGVGPNLTDDYWLHGGGIKDVFKSIKYGWQDKGMKSWKDDFSPRQIAQIASYVKSLHGTKPLAPKDKQGEMYIEAKPVVDSAANKVVKN